VKTLAEVITHSPEETVAFGRELAEYLRPPCLALLEGELGSGKTTLVKGIVAGLGAGREEDVTSPSFTLVHEYGLPALVRQPADVAIRQPGGGGVERPTDQPLDAELVQAGLAGKVYHVDLYRIEDARELATLGLEDLAGQDATVLVEWGEKLAGSGPVPPGGFRIRMEHLGSEDRRITVERLET
jgi:tRNA threonylcarbamoyladenosine biosynthesis protein TsaE